jgi:glucose-1-phosphate thymidylyltransferase
MLGDNVFGSLLDLRLPHEMAARFFVKRVPDPCRFGIAEVDGEGRLLGIEEKPRSPKSDLAVAGAYLYGAGIWAAIDSIAPSERGELEISDANEALMSMEPGTVQVVAVLGWWSDAGTRPSYHRANEEIGRVISPSLARRLNAMCGGDAPVFADEEPTILPDGEDAEWPYESQSALERAAP